MIGETRKVVLTVFAFLLLPPILIRGEEAEWTMERALREWKPMARAVQHVGVPGYEFQTGVFWNGSLFFGPEVESRKEAAMQEETRRLGNNALHLSIGYGDSFAIPDRLGNGDRDISHGLEEGYLPIPRIWLNHDGLSWTETVAAALFDRSMKSGMNPMKDDVLVTFVRFQVKNAENSPKTGRLWLHFGDTSQVELGYKFGQGNELGQALEHRFEPPFGTVNEGVRYIISSPARGKLVWHESGPVPAGMSKVPARVIEWNVPLAPRETAELILRIPYQAISHERALRLHKVEFAEVYNKAHDFYAELASSIGQITTPEPFLNDYLKAVTGQMTQQIAYRHLAKVWMYKTSPNHYEFYWPCNAAKALPTLDLRGLTAYSRPVLQSYIDTQSADYGRLTQEIGGKAVKGDGFERIPGFLGNFGPWTANTLLLSHGLEMWALASHFRITRDRVWLGDGAGSPLQSLLDGFDWVAKQRRRTMKMEGGRKVPHWGLLPAASAHDWFSGNTIFNDAFCIFGMTETVRLLREIKHPRTEEMAAELNDYRSTLKQRYIEARDKARRVPLADGTTMPFVPRDVYELDWSKPDWTYTGYGPLRAGAWGAFDPNDELVTQSLAFLEAGMPKGEGYYIKPAKNKYGQTTADENFRSISDPAADRHYMWRHYVEYETMWPIGMDLFLQRDDLPRFFEWLYNNLAVVLHREYRVGVESLDGVPSNAPGEGERWRAVRDMFVNERGGYDGSQQSLWLMQAIPRAWLKPGNQIGVKEMGTHFGGRVNLNCTVAANGTVAVDLTLNLDVLPKEIRLRLRSGDGRPLQEARINGAKSAILEGETIRLPTRLHGKYRIVGQF